MCSWCFLGELCRAPAIAARWEVAVAGRWFTTWYVRVAATDVGLDVYFFPRGRVEASWGVRWRMPVERATLVVRDSSMALKWLKEALAKAKKGKSADLVRVPFLHDGREALEEFMTATTGPDGQPRDPSCLMVQVVEDGVRVGLKDEECGGWCWRAGDTLQEALDAVEKALRAGQGAFRGNALRGKKR